LAALLRLEAHRHLALATDQVLGEAILQIEEAVRVAQAELLVADAAAVDLNPEIGRGPSPVAAEVGRDQDHGVAGLDRQIIGEPRPAPAPRPAQDSLWLGAFARLIIELPLEDDLAGLEVRDGSRCGLPQPLRF